MAIDREAWLAQRRSGVGGSDVAAILGLSPWSTPLDVYESKVGAAPMSEPNEPMRWGTLLEDVVAREFADREGVRVQRVRTMLRHPAHPFAIANIDRAIVAPGVRARVDNRTGWLAGATDLLEVKTGSAFGLADWGDDDAPTIPLHYAAQGMWYLGVTGAARVRFAALLGGQRYFTRMLERDDAAIASMFDVAEAFWREHVEAQVPPPPTSVADMMRRYPRDDGAMREIANDADAMRDVAALLEFRERIKALQAEADKLTDALKMRIADAAGLSVRGCPVATWKAGKDKATTDWQGVALDLQGRFDIPKDDFARSVEAFTTTAPGDRRFYLKDSKEQSA